jgi:hypothetical protein
MSARNVGDRTKCECTLGTAQGILGVPSCETIKLRGGVNALNILDQTFLTPFGSCRRDKAKTLPCTPKPAGPWSDYAPGVYVGKDPALVETAKMRCVYGGEISITDPGTVTNIHSGFERNCDELFVGADGRAVIARGTCEEVKRIKLSEALKEFNQRADDYLNNPFRSALEELAKMWTDSKKRERARRPRGRSPRRGR